MVKEHRDRPQSEIQPASTPETQKPVERPLYEDLGFESQADMDHARSKFAEIAKERDVAKAQRLKDKLLESFIAKAEHQEGGANVARRLQIDQGNEFLAAIAAEPDVVKADKLRAELRRYQDKNDDLETPHDQLVFADDDSRSQADQHARERIAAMETELAEGREILLSPNAAGETEAESAGRRRYEDVDMMLARLDGRYAPASTTLTVDDKTPVMRRDGKPQD